MKMLPTVLSNLFSSPATRRYPFEKREPFERARGELTNDITRCIFCGTCARKCPSQCIKVERQGTEGTWTLDFFACIQCGICVMNCPVKSLSQKKTYRPITTERSVIALHGKLPVRPAKKTEKPAPKPAAPAAPAASKPAAPAQ